MDAFLLDGIFLRDLACSFIPLDPCFTKVECYIWRSMLRTWLSLPSPLDNSASSHDHMRIYTK